MILVVWAASFGLDERGLPPDNHSGTDSLVFSNAEDEGNSADLGELTDDFQDLKWREKKDKTDAMLREVLELIDFHGVLRRPTLDGIRALLLILPLLEGTQLLSLSPPISPDSIFALDAQPLERNAIREATLSQALALCISGYNPPEPTPFPEHNDALIRARIFWYAHTQEGLFTGLKGGRFVL